MESVDGYDGPERATEDDLLYGDPDKTSQTLVLQDEWKLSSTFQTKEQNLPEEKPIVKEKPTELTAKQKKKLRMKEKYKNKPKSKSSGQPKPTGFEEFFTESPLTPEEHVYIRNIYVSGRPVIFRLQEALSRYQQKRRLLNERMQVFAQYLRYGGVDVGAKMFGGVSEMELKAMDKESIIIARSQTDISIDKMKLAVDFELVVRGFLSFYFPDYYSPESLDAIKMATVTIRNWLNYLLYHDVVPEYADNIKSALRYCDLAERQLWDNMKLLSVSPGDFNKASSFLFGGYYYDKRGQSDQLDVWGGEKHNRVTMNKAIARKVVMFALASSASDEQATHFTELLSRDELSARPIEDIDGFEIVDILTPNDGVREFYEEHAPDLNPIGKLRAKAWRDPNGPKIDLAPNEELPNINDWEFEFFVEDTFLQYCYAGMKIVTKVWELSCGVFYFDEILNTYCSFYTAILNDLMLGWKDPLEITKGTEQDEEKESEEVTTTGRGPTIDG